MNTTRNRLLIGVVAICLAVLCRNWLMSCTELPDDELESLQPKLSARFDPYLVTRELIRPLHQLKRPNQPGDWLDRFQENGQTFRQYVRDHAERPLCDDFHGIDIKPLGEFDETQLRLVKLTAEFMQHYFGVPVQLAEPEPFPEIPEESRRMRDDTEQILTKWIMHDVLKPERRPDAIATLALVTCDLWPGHLNWVFGEASISERLGVWSLHRNGDPRVSPDEFRLCLRRTLKTAMHETGHMLGIPHCISHECCMNGSRSREENDRQPLEFCPECQPKIWWTCGADPVTRVQGLFEFCQREGLDAEADLFRREGVVLESGRSR